MQEIITQNYIAIIIGLVIMVFLIMYFLVKKPKKTFQEIDIDEEVKPQKIIKEDIKPKKEPEIVKSKKIDRKKRELITHEKITKDDFSIFKNVKILIAEDNPINQKVILSLLADSQIDITVANDGKECLDILKKDSDFSMILMDAHMPIIDGFETTKSIRANPNYEHIPVIALSGDTATDDIKKMMNAGMEGHLEKPLKMNQLYDTLYVYTTGEEKNESSFKPNNTAQELNVKKGLDICGGDKEFYLEILNDFTSKYSDSAVKLQKHINNTQSVDADKLLLDISGVASNIGADNLHNRAIDLKDSIINHPTDLEYINNLKEYKRSLVKVCEAIQKYKTSL
jgi:CheY-like chemotaxis protein